MGPVISTMPTFFTPKLLATMLVCFPKLNDIMIMAKINNVIHNHLKSVLGGVIPALSIKSTFGLDRYFVHTLTRSIFLCLQL